MSNEGEPTELSTSEWVKEGARRGAAVDAIHPTRVPEFAQWVHKGSRGPSLGRRSLHPWRCYRAAAKTPGRVDQQSLAGRKARVEEGDGKSEGRERGHQPLERHRGT